MKISRFRGRAQKTAKLKCREKYISSSTAKLKCTKISTTTKITRFLSLNEFSLTYFQTLHKNYCLRSQKRVKNTPFWNKQVISIFSFYLQREIKMQRNLYFCLDREIKMPRNVILTKKTAKLK